MIRLFRVFVPVGTVTLLLSETLLVASAFILATFLVLEVDPTVFLLYDGGLVRMSVVLLSIPIGLHFHDLYSQYFVKSRIVLVQLLCLVMGVAFLFQGMMSYVNTNLRVPIRIMLLGSAFAVVAIYGWRLLFSKYAVRVCGQVCIRELRPSQLIYSGELGPRPQDVAYQHAINSLIAGAVLVLASPFLLLTAIAVRLSSPGPVVLYGRCAWG